MKVKDVVLNIALKNENFVIIIAFPNLKGIINRICLIILPPPI